MHPRTEKSLRRIGLYSTLKSTSNIIVMKPLGYLDFINLLRNSRACITDSGGVQREAYLLKVPCIVLRRKTEWVELVKSGWAFLMDINRELVLKSLENIISRQVSYPEWKPLLGDGRASEKIVEIICKELFKDQNPGKY